MDRKTSTIVPKGLSIKLEKEILAQIVDTSDAIIVISDIESKQILFANSCFIERIGFNPVGRRCTNFLHEQGASSCILCGDSGRFFYQGEPAKPFYREYRNPFDKKYYEVKSRAIRWSDGRYVRLEIGYEITEQKRLASFLKEARTQAENAEYTRSRYVALVAHDLKSPFVSIVGMLRRILKKETFAHDAHRVYLESIISSGQRMLRMVDNLLDMERLDKGDVVPEPLHFDVKIMVDEVLHDFTLLAKEKGVELLNRVPKDVKIFADRYLYFIVLNNLISNAVKFSYDESEISVEFTEMENGELYLGVRDRGPGMPESFIDDVFKSDVKTTSPGTGGESGTGFGLVLCKQIMDAHGGSIEIESERGVGTTMWIKLFPLKLPKARSQQSPVG